MQWGEVLVGTGLVLRVPGCCQEQEEHILQPVFAAPPQVCVPAGQWGLLRQLCHRLCLHRECHGPAAHPRLANVHDTPLPGPLGR